MALSKKSFLAGLIAGVVLAGGSAVFAGQSISASIADVNYKFNGVQTPLTSGYVSINYGGHTYVPARFIGEQLGATVGWDSSSNTVTVDSNGGGSGGGSGSSTGGGSSKSSGETVGNYTISNYKMTTDTFGNTDVIGEIVNNDSINHTFTLTVNFYDASGTLLGTADDVIADLPPGQKKSFEADAYSVISGVNTYSFQIDNEF